MENQSDGEMQNQDIKHLKILGVEMWNLRSQNSFCDVIFHVGGEMLSAHSVVLAACSPVLRKMCFDSSRTTFGILSIFVTEFSYKVCLKMLEYIYTGRNFSALESHFGEEFVKLSEEWQVKCCTGRNEEDSCMDILLSEDSGSNTGTNVTTEKAQDQLPRQSVLPNRTTGKRQDVEKRVSPKKKKKKKKKPQNTFIKEESASENQPKDEQEFKVTIPKNRTRRKCNKCKIRFETYDEYKAHEKKEHNKNLARRESNTCKICNIRFPHKNRKVLHDIAEHGRDDLTERVTVYKCKYEGCAFESIEPHKMQKHKERIHDPPPRPVCEECGQDFVNSFHLKKHKRVVHENAEEGYCDICDMKFNTFDGLQSHNNNFHVGKGKPQMVCNVCGRKMKDKSTFREHMFTAHDQLIQPEKLVSCEKCDFKTTLKAKIEAHRRTHEPKQRPACHLCDKTFCNEKTLQFHLRIHNNTAPLYNCPYCEYKSVYGAGSIVTHIKCVHKDEDTHPFKCPECTHKTAIKKIHQRHMAIKHNKPITDKIDNPQIPEGWALNKRNNSRGKWTGPDEFNPTSDTSKKKANVAHDNSNSQYQDIGVNVPINFSNENVQVRNTLSDYGHPRNELETAVFPIMQDAVSNVALVHGSQLMPLPGPFIANQSNEVQNWNFQNLSTYPPP